VRQVWIWFNCEFFPAIADVPPTLHGRSVPACRNRLYAKRSFFLRLAERSLFLRPTLFASLYKLVYEFFATTLLAFSLAFRVIPLITDVLGALENFQGPLPRAHTNSGRIVATLGVLAIGYVRPLLFHPSAKLLLIGHYHSMLSM
jgi:hypothetical protein